MVDPIIQPLIIQLVQERPEADIVDRIVKLVQEQASGLSVQAVRLTHTTQILQLITRRASPSAERKSPLRI